jgi:TP901 family phage tail tape measure protein/lambda family phage tail tape measure protein
MDPVDRKLVVQGEADFTKLRKEFSDTKQLLLDLQKTAARVQGTMTRLEGGTSRGAGANPLLKALGGEKGVANIEKAVENGVGRYTKALRDAIKGIQAEAADALLRNARVTAEVSKISANSISESSRIVQARLQVAKQAAELPLKQLTDRFVAQGNSGLTAFAGGLRSGGLGSIEDNQLLQLKAREQAAELLRQRAIGQQALMNTEATRKEVELRTRQLGVIQGILKDLGAQVNITRQIEQIEARIEKRQLTRKLDLEAQIAANRRLVREMEAANIRIFRASTEGVQSQINRRLVRDRSGDQEYIRLRTKLEREAEKAAAAEARRVQAEERAKQPRGSQMAPGALAQQSRQKTLDRIGGAEGGAFLFEIQSRLMLNYRLMGGVIQGIQNGITFVIQFEDELKKLQGISGITSTELTKLRDVILDVSEGTRFAAVELTKASVVLAQAGLSTEQIGQVLKPIIQLAQGTGSEVGKVVEVFTSILGVFNVKTSESVNIANQLAGALNASKLDIEKFALATQYAANTAAQSNVSFSEFSAVLATLSNAGIRSGSTLGTGLSQLITQLIVPTDELQKALKQVGLTVSDVDVRSKGLIGVLETLKNSGFGAAQAFQGLDLRAARTLVALNRNTDALLENQRQILLSEAATFGSKTATESFAASVDILRANFGALAADLSQNLLRGLTDVTKIVASAVAGMREFSGVIGVMLNIAGGVALVALAKYILGVSIALGRNIFGVTSLVTAYKALIPTQIAAARTFDPLALGATAATAAVGRLTIAMRLLRLTGPLLLFAAFELVANGLLSLGSRMDENAKKMEKARTDANEAQQRLQAQREEMNAVSAAIQTVNERYDYLSKNEKALQVEILSLNKQFADQGMALSLNTKKVDDLIAALMRLKQASNQKYVLDLSVAGDAMDKQRRVNSSTFESLVNPALLNQNLGLVQERRGATDQLRRLPEIQKIWDAINSLKGQGIESLAQDGEFGSDLVTAAATLQEKLRALHAMKKDGKSSHNGMFINNQILIMEKTLNYIRQLSASLNIELEMASKLNVHKNETRTAVAQLDPRLVTMEKSEQEYARTLKGMVDKAEKSGIADQPALVAEIDAFIKSAKDQSAQQLAEIVKDMDEDQKRIFTEAYNRSAGQAAGETTAREIPRIEKIREQALKSRALIVKRDIDILEEELAFINDQMVKSKSTGSRVALQAQAQAKLEEIESKKDELTKIELEQRKDKVDRLSIEIQREQARANKADAQVAKEQQAQDEADRRAKEQEDALGEAMQRRANRQIDAIKKTLSGETGKALSAEQKAELMLKIEELLIEILNLRVQAIIRAARAAGKDLNDPVVKDQMDAARDEMFATLDGINDGFRESGAKEAKQEMSQAFKNSIARLKRAFRDLNDVLDRAAKDLDIANQQADGAVNRFSAKQESYNSPQNKNRIPGVMAEAERIDQQFNVDNTARQAKITNEQQYLTMLQQQRAELAKLLQQARDLLAEKIKLEGLKVSVGDLTDPDKDLQGYSQTVNVAAEEARKYESRLKDLEQQIASTSMKLGQMTDQQTILNTRMADPSLWQAIQAGVKVWQNQTNAAKSFTATIGDAVPQVLTDISGAFDQFSENLINNTMSIKDAFKALAKSILASMLKVINDAITKQFMGLLGSLLGGSPASSGPSAFMGISSGGDDVLFSRAGGYVRKAAGGVTTRDSVHAYVQPGEYIMRQSAVESVGRENLDRINSMGNRRVGEHTSNVVPFRNEKRQPDNVNVWVVSPDQKPPPGPKDIIAVIGQDIRNGGSTKQLIKSVQQGG